MLRRLSIFAVLLAAAGTALSAPAYAVGHVICVGSPVGTCDEHQSTIQLALSSAAGNGQANTIPPSHARTVVGVVAVQPGSPGRTFAERPRGH